MPIPNANPFHSWAGRQISRWTVLLVTLVVAAAAAATIGILRQQAAKNHRTEVLLTLIEGHSHRLNAIAWQVISQQRVSPKMAVETQKARAEMMRTFNELQSINPQEKRLQPVFDAYSEYEAALEEELRLIAAGKPARAKALDSERVYPWFNKFREVVANVNAAYSLEAKEKDRTAFILSTLIFLAAAMITGLLFRRFQRARQVAELMAAEQGALRWAEEQLRSSREQLRNLSAYLQAMREEERTNIAREIHDELGQVLTALKMDASWLGSKYKDYEPIADKTKSMASLIDSTIRTVKRICTELRPGVLDDLGLIAAIEWQSEEFQKRTGILCEVSFLPDDIALDGERSTAIFRILQEALTNVIRHAEATRVRVLLEKEEGHVLLRVEDNGKGITEDQILDPRSFGLIGIRERARFLGGKVRIEGSADKGTAVTVSLPLKNGQVQ